jgi:acyl carrier protein
MHDSIDEIKKFIRGKHKVEKQFSDHDDIFEKRLIDSLHFVEFTLFLEQLSGKTIDLENIDLDDFRTVAKIKQVFFPA